MTERDWKKDLEICEKATPGPWYTKKTGANFNGFSLEYTIATISHNQKIYACPPSGRFPANDLEFIATAREALPYYIKQWKAEYDRRIELEKEIEKLKLWAIKFRLV